MADEDDQGGADAAEAFEAMRGELALLRRAVEGLAAERGAIDVLDYSETLGALQQSVDTITGRINAIGQILAKSPALAITPEQMTQRIAAAGSAARREDQAALATARKGLEDVTRQLHGLVASARRGDEQNKWLAWVAIGGAVLGIIMWAAFAGPIARAVPEGWHWPEHMAARMLDRPMWDAGQRMMNIAAPESWRAIVVGDKIVSGNRDTIDGCSEAAARVRDTVRCTIRVAPTSKR